MATVQNGRIVSFSNTPQARSDAYSWTEDQLLGLNVFNSQTDIVSLDVTANDLGGKAKTLYSVDDGVNYLTDLLHEDGVANGASAWEAIISATGGGDQIRIHSGLVELDLSASIRALTGGSSDLRALAAGDTIHDTFVYAIQLGNGALSWSTVAVDIRGSNDAATITGTNTGSVKEDTPGQTTTGGVLTVHDVDHGENLFQQPASLGGTYGAFSFDAGTGVWGYGLDHDLANNLSDGQVVHDRLVVTSADGTASETIDVTITGTGEATQAPKVLGITQTDPATTDAGVLHYQITFSEPVTGVDAGQFSLITTGGLTGAEITDVSPVEGGAGAQYLVSIGTGAGDGTIALVVNGGGIQDAAGHALQGAFDGAVNYQTDLLPVAVNIGDLNGDGILDLVTANIGRFGSSTVSVLLGNGDGTFQQRVDYAPESYSTNVQIGDLNGDGRPDLAVLNENNNHDGNSTVSTMLGNGDGTFQYQGAYAVGRYASGVAVADLNGDGKLDFVVGHTESVEASVSVLLGNGDGTFQSATSYGAGTNPASVAVGDLNGDGNQDIVTANSVDGTVSILLGNGEGTFQDQVAYAAGPSPFSVVIADLNGDGKSDLAVVNAIGTYGVEGSVSIMLGNGDGTVQTPASYRTGGLLPSSLAVGDLNGDGTPDLAVTNSNSESVAFLLGSGDGSFQFQAGYGTNGSTPHTNPTSVAIGDLNGDGQADLAVANYVSDYISTPTVSVLINNGSPVEGAAYTVDRHDWQVI